MLASVQQPDPVVLRAQLDQALAERDVLDKRITWLQQGVELFAGAEAAVVVPERIEEPEASHPPEPAPRRQSSSRSASRSPKPMTRDTEGKVLSAVLKANQPLSAQDIADQTGIPRGSLKKILRRLVDNRQVAAEGATRTRRYRSVERESFHTAHRERTEAGRKRNGDAESARLAGVVLRDRVMKAVAADDNALTAGKLAEALNVAAADVEQALAWLVERDRLHLNDDGTYRRNGRRAMA